MPYNWICARFEAPAAKIAAHWGRKHPETSILRTFHRPSISRLSTQPYVGMCGRYVNDPAYRRHIPSHLDRVSSLPVPRLGCLSVPAGGICYNKTALIVPGVLTAPEAACRCNLGASQGAPTEMELDPRFHPEQGSTLSPLFAACDPAMNVGAARERRQQRI